MSHIQFEEEEFSTQFNGRTLLRMAAQLKPHKGLTIGFLVGIGLVSILDAVFTYLSKLIIDEGIVAGNPERLVELVTIYGGVMLVQAIAVFGFIYAAGVLGEQVAYDLRKKMFNHLQSLSFSYFDRTPVGWVMSRITSDSTRIAELVSWGLLDITWGVIGISTSLVFMFVINAQLALIVMLVVPVLLVVAFEFKKRIITEFREVRKMNSRITGSFNESITGVKVVKALSREEDNLQEFDGLATDMYRASYRAAWLSALFLPVVQIISALALGAIIWFGGLQIQGGTMTIGDIQAFVSYLVFMLFPIQEMARVYAGMQQSIASAERVFSLIDSEPDIVNRPGATDQGSIRRDIVFENVNFSYEPDKPVLRDFSLTIKQGETIALVGPTGAGKSTIVNLVCRFYEPTSGLIRFGDADYTDLTLHAIQSRIGMVLQTPHLFSGTIRENIRYGRLQATDEEIEAAATLVHAHEFIIELEKGYDTEVGEGGSLLSVGQKQLLSLARAVLVDPDLLVMDEATSSVDTVTEALIQKGMERLMTGRTSLVIAHRLSTIRRADRILVIEAGQIAEVGTHYELMRARGHYYSLYTKQFREEAERQMAALV